MERIICIVVFLAIISASNATSIESVEPVENSIDGRAFVNRLGVAQNSLVQIVRCVVETIDAVHAEYRIQGVWKDVQTKLHGNIGRLFACLRYSGFAAQGYSFYPSNFYL